MRTKSNCKHFSPETLFLECEYDMLYMKWFDSRDCFEVGFEESGLVALYLPVLDRYVIEIGVQLYGLVGSSGVLILTRSGHR